MIKKYIYGNPIETDAVIDHISVCEEPLEELNEITSADGSMLFTYLMEKDDIVYGLG